DVNNAGFNVIVKMNGVPVHTLSRTGSIKTNAGWELKVSGTIRSIGASGTYVDTAILIDGEHVSASASPAEVPIDTTASFLYEVYVQWDTAAIGSVLQCTQGRIEVGG
ncbi:MAG: hypothetical protein KJO69_01555, partial [Gammaproteobacteria bacterium]|nr:hypothetical protein [Gammaproteobacteria bacterium]